MNRPLLAAFACYAAGVLLASLLKIPIAFILSAAIISIILSVFTRRYKRDVFITFVLFSIFFLGAAAYYNFTFIPSSHIANKVHKLQGKVYIKGFIASDPLRHKTPWGQERTTFVFNTENIRENDGWINSTGLLRAIIYDSKKQYRFGENLILFGRLQPAPRAANPGEFDYSQYLKQQQIYAIFEIGKDKDAVLYTKEAKPNLLNTLKAKIFSLRKEIDYQIHRYLPKDEAALFSAMTLGLRSEIPSETKDIFVQTGTAHILAISGLHLAVIAYILFFAFGLLRMPHNLRAILLISAVFLYAILCGATPSVVRSSIMICAFMLAYLLNREIDAYNILSLTGILMLMVNPMQLFNIGFILSFTCVFSIIYLTPKIENIFKIKKGNKIPTYIFRLLSMSLAVYIGVWPIIAYNFNIISPVTVIANLLVVPLANLLICVGSVFVLSAVLALPFAPVFGNTTWLVAFLLKKSILYLSKIPFAYFYISDLPLWVIGFYYALIILAIHRKRIKLSKGAVCIIALIFVNFCVWLPLVKRQAPELKITFLHVGHGDAAFVQFPNGQTMLIDTGIKDVVTPYIWSEGKTKIDYMLITHGDEDHFKAATSIINKAKVRYFLYNGINEGEKGYSGLLDLVKSKAIKTIFLKEGYKIEGLGGVEIFALNPPDEFIADRAISKNDSSIVLKLIYKNVNFLLCADVLEKGIKNILPYGNFLKSDIVKVPHHGSGIDQNISEQLYNLVNPKIAIITASKYYQYPIPSEATLELLRENGISPYITYQGGAVIITSDGKDYHVKTFLRY